jgi:uncharacterized damage-inducible protein DinB
MTPDNANAILQFVTGYIEREHPTTKKVLAAVPAEKCDYAPDPKCMKSLDLAWHIASAEQLFMAGAANGEFTRTGGKRPDEMSSPEKIVAWYEQQTSENLAKVKAMTPEQSLRVVDFFGIWQMPAVHWLQFLLTHSIHHRGQLSSYLRPMGAKVPSIYGPSGDEQPQQAAKS